MKNIVLFAPTVVVCYLACLLLAFQAHKSGYRLRALGIRNLAVAPRDTLLRFRDEKIQQPADLVIVGASHAYRGFDTRVFRRAGYRAFNLGSTIQTPINSFYALPPYIEKLQPKTIIYEVYWGAIGWDPAECTLDLAINSRLTPGLARLILETGDLRILNSLALELLRRIEVPLAKRPTPDLWGRRYHRGGYVSATRRYQPSRDYGVKVLPQKQLDYLERFVELMQEKDIRVILVMAPVIPAHRPPVKQYEKLLAPLVQLADEKGLTFLDFNTSPLREQLDLRRRDFYDSDHLNHSGVEKFNRLLLEIWDVPLPARSK